MRKTRLLPWVKWSDVVEDYHSIGGQIPKPTAEQLYDFFDANGVLIHISPPSANKSYWSWGILALDPYPVTYWTEYESREATELEAFYGALEILTHRYRTSHSITT